MVYIVDEIWLLKNIRTPYNLKLYSKSNEEIFPLTENGINLKYLIGCFETMAKPEQYIAEDTPSHLMSDISSTWVIIQPI